MKKSILCALALLLLLAGCSAGKETASYTVDDAQTLLDAGLFDGDMAPMDSYVISLLYGIDEDTISDCAGYMAANTSSSADELTVLVLTDEEAAQAAAEACQARVNSQITVCRDYTPAAVPRLENAVIRRAGNTVLLAVGDPDRLPDAVDSLH